MKRYKQAVVAAAAAITAAAGSADAAVVTRSYVTTATFANAPVSEVSFSYALTFDPLRFNPNGTVANYTTTSALPSFAGPVIVAFDFGSVAIGRSPSGTGVTEGTDDFTIAFNFDDRGDPIADTTLVYFTRSSPGTFFATTAATAVAGVPEPATWGFMILGFGVVGARTRRRRTGIAFA